MPRTRLIPVNSDADVPVFTNEDEEAEFWSTHELGPDLLEQMQPIPPEGDATFPPAYIPVEREDIPVFADEEAEHEFWSTHTFGPKLLAEMRPDFDPELPSPDEMRAAHAARRAKANLPPADAR